VLNNERLSLCILRDSSSGSTRLRSWLRHCATSRKVEVSIPDEVIEFTSPNYSSSIFALGVDSASWIFLGVKGGRLTNSPPSLCRFSTNCGSLDVSQSYRPPRLVTRIALTSSSFFSVVDLVAREEMPDVGGGVFFPSFYLLSGFTDVLECLQAYL
jgi:hypothetical protein